MHINALALAVLLSAALPFVPASALAVIDPDAEIIRVEKDCGTQDDCFETIAAALAWTWNTRVPSAADPLLWVIGPGTWNEKWECPTGNGHVTVRGAGRESTVITGGASSFEAGLATDCDALEFMDLRFQHPVWAFRWVLGGSSTWNDVDLVAVEGSSGGLNESAAWFDDVCLQGQEEIALHYFFGSRLVVEDGTGTAYPPTPWYGNCSEGWFFGGEIVIEFSEDSANLPTLAHLGDRADLRVFGSVMRGVVSPPNNGVLLGVHAAHATSTFHMHGGIISLNASSGNVNTLGIVSVSGATVHTPDTAFVLNPSGTGVAHRIVGVGNVQSPFQWQAGTTPPNSTEGSVNFTSADGQDMFVETDCDSSGDCNGAGTETHLMIYNLAECGACMPWFDVVTGSCRPDPNPGTGGACDP